MSAMGSTSETNAFFQVYEDHRKNLADLMANASPPEGACGAAFVARGKLVGLDLFDRPSTLAKLWAKLFGAYALDAIEPTSEGPKVPPGPEEVARWVHSGASARAASFPSPGLGVDIRLDAANLIGASLVVDDRPIHLELFRLTDGQVT